MKTRSICALLFTLVLTACGPSKSKNGLSGNQNFEKPDPGVNSLCYAGDSRAGYTCVEADASDSSGIRKVANYCGRMMGQSATGACPVKKLVATCMLMKNAPTLKMRFYGYDLTQAEEFCDGEQGKLIKKE